MDPQARWLAYGAAAAAVLAALVPAACGLGVRAGVWTSRAGLVGLRLSFFLALFGAVQAVAALLVLRPRGAAGLLAAGALVVSGAVLSLPVLMILQARRVPAIHDVTTDTADPPAFVAVLPLRAGAPNAAAYGGPEVAAKQARAYPELQPLHLAAAPAAAFEPALAAARAMSWAIVAADPVAGRIEATATTRWLGFQDDVVVRLRPEGGGTRVDVRSVSRVGRSDLGTNARRIREYLARLAG
ncbi:MAG TPA: DUF1499 domain-containing protein [Thermoanaerobaculia bacterium]|jgi:uncharacterized protein (DUF1499 family)|nr:DUF1499 domain-containing protein [Thermoanaerobaculia bacterium]